MTSDRYVATRSIREAMKGRETEVLEALGIAWQEGAPHISCPDGNPSWRWDERRARAYCSCIERSHSIFDVLMHVEGIDFEAAKLRVAEVLGVGELIKVRKGQRYPKTDARSLLAPPVDERDNDLVRAYLANRLNVAPDQVPMPSTAVAGWRALAYYDPPKGKGTKPTLVGHYPCAVFGIVAPDGRRHAHRIYVAPGGTGKAELGSRFDGRPRDPKKSAKLEDGHSAAGCAVLWGDPGEAPHLILTEGIETATAVALAHHAEIEAGELTVAAALSTAGITSFQPWPATRRIAVAADRDEARSPDDRGYRAGETAARSLALAHHDRVEVRIALPGEPGEDVDWLDVLRCHGCATVRAGLDAAELFDPTPRRSRTPGGALSAPTSSPRSSASTRCPPWRA